MIAFFQGKSYDYLAPGLRGFLIRSYIVFYYPRKNSIEIARILSGYRDLDALFNPEPDAPQGEEK